MFFEHNFLQLLCLAVVLFLTLPIKAAIVLSVIAMMFAYHPAAVSVIYLYLLGLAVYKGISVYRKQSKMPGPMSIVATIVLTVVLWTVFMFVYVAGVNPLLISLILVILTPKVTAYVRANPINLYGVMNKRMLVSMLLFAVTFQLIDGVSQGSPFVEEGSSVLLVWLLAISGILAYGLALHRIPALIVSAVFYLISVMYIVELFSLRPYLAELRRFSDVFDVFSPWLLTLFVIHLVSLVCILVYTFGYNANPLPAAQILARFSGLGAKVQQQKATGMESAKAFAQNHQLDNKLEHVSGQIKQHLARADYAGKFQQQLNRLTAAHQHDPRGVKIKAAVVGGVVLLLCFIAF